MYHSEIFFKDGVQNILRQLGNAHITAWCISHCIMHIKFTNTLMHIIQHDEQNYVFCLENLMMPRMLHDEKALYNHIPLHNTHSTTCCTYNCIMNIMLLNAQNTVWCKEHYHHAAQNTVLWTSCHIMHRTLHDVMTSS